MASALNFSLNPTFGTDFSLNNLAAKRFKLVVGEFTYDAASSSALTVTTAMVGLNDIRGFVASPKDNIFWTFNPGADTLQPCIGGRCSVTISATGVFTGMVDFKSTASLAVASITSVPFLCWGFE